MYYVFYNDVNLTLRNYDQFGGVIGLQDTSLSSQIEKIYIFFIYLIEYNNQLSFFRVFSISIQ